MVEKISTEWNPGQTTTRKISTACRPLAEQDANANNTLQASEDINGNGVLDPPDDYRNTDIHSAFRYQTLIGCSSL